MTYCLSSKKISWKKMKRTMYFGGHMKWSNILILILPSRAEKVAGLTQICLSQRKRSSIWPGCLPNYLFQIPWLFWLFQLNSLLRRRVKIPPLLIKRSFIIWNNWLKLFVSMFYSECWLNWHMFSPTCIFRYIQVGPVPTIALLRRKVGVRQNPICCARSTWWKIELQWLFLLNWVVAYAA